MIQDLCMSALHDPPNLSISGALFCKIRENLKNRVIKAIRGQLLERCHSPHDFQLA